MLLRKKLTSHQFRTGSDCEVLAHLVSVLENLFDFWLSFYKFPLEYLWRIFFLLIMNSEWLLWCDQYEEHGEEFVDMLDGMFSFVLLDTKDKSFIAARDAIGITPLYLGWGHDGI